jgi:protein O-GlcNAc transferase
MPAYSSSPSQPSTVSESTDLKNSLSGPVPSPVVFAGLRSAIAHYLEQPGSEELWTELLRARAAASAVLARVPRGETQSVLANVGRQLVRELSAAGAHDRAVPTGELAEANALASGGWPGLLAAMLLVPAWQWSNRPHIDSVPAWLWPDYVAYLFTTPQGFCANGQAEVYAAYYLSRIEELARLAAINRGSTQVQAAVRAYLVASNCIQLYFSQSALRRHYEVRGRLLKAAFAVPAQEEILPLPRDGRHLRVGFVNRHFAPQTETYTTLPTFEQLDPERFEVLLFVHHGSGMPVENFARERVSAFQVLPAEFEAQLEVLRAAQLDVVVFGTNVTAVPNEVTRLALYRVAPLQVANNSSCTTTGLPEIDLYISGSLTESAEAPTHFTERLGLLRGPTHAFNYEADQQQPTTAWTRAALGLPEDAIVFVSAANYFKVIPEMQEAWARLLAAVPSSRLLVHPFNPNWSSEYPIKRFRAGFDRVLAAHGVEPDRLVVSTTRFHSRTDVKELLRVGDIYLDSFPFSGVNSLVDPLEIGIPVITWEGTTFRSRMGSALLRSLGLAEFVATDAESYHAICTGLAGNAPRRSELRSTIADLMDRKPIFMDTLAASDAFGELLNLAYDELVQTGSLAFRQSKAVITATNDMTIESVATTVNYLLELGMTDEAARQAQNLLGFDPVSVVGRHLMGKVLLAQGRVTRAMDYLLAAVHSGTAAAVVWRDLATALRRSGNRTGASQALEAALRLDVNDVESWFMLADCALECGQHEILVETSQIIMRLAPDDPRTSRIAGECTKLARPVAV